MIAEQYPPTALDGLIAKLNELARSNSHVNDPSVFLTDNPMPLVEDIVELAETCLITPTGEPHGANIAMVKQAGYRVGSGEMDYFGWLTGVICTPKGKIVYG